MSLVVPEALLQEIVITNLNNNPGILPHKLGNARIKSKFHTFIHYVDLKPITEQISLLENQYVKLITPLQNNSKDGYFFYQLQNLENAVSIQLNFAKQKIGLMNPHSKVKRGLIDGLGTIIKSISGNLDANDAVRYDKAIKDLEKNQQGIVTTLNKEISLTTKAVENFNTTLTLINNNQQIITASMNRIQNCYNKLILNLEAYIEIRGVIDHISVSLNIIIQLLNDIETAVTFAQLGVYHNSILKMDELQSIITTVLKYNSLNQLLYTSDEAHKYYELLETSAYQSNHKIVFIIHFPIMYPDLFSYYHLYSIPTEQMTTIVPRNSYLLTDKNSYYYSPTPCKNLHTVYYCPNGKITAIMEKDDCIFELLQTTSKYHECQEVPVQVTRNIIEQIDESYYIAILPSPQKLKTICERVDFTVLHGNFLLNLPLGCSFEVNSSKFINNKKISIGQPMLLPRIQIANRKPSKLLQKININEVKLDKIHQLQKEQEKLETVKLSVHHPESWITTFSVTPIYILLGILAIYYVAKIWMERRKRLLMQPTIVEPGSYSTP